MLSCLLRMGMYAYVHIYLSIAGWYVGMYGSTLSPTPAGTIDSTDDQPAQKRYPIGKRNFCFRKVVLRGFNQEWLVLSWRYIEHHRFFAAIDELYQFKHVRTKTVILQVLPCNFAIMPVAGARRNRMIGWLMLCAKLKCKRRGAAWNEFKWSHGC